MSRIRLLTKIAAIGVFGGVFLLYPWSSRAAAGSSAFHEIAPILMYHYIETAPATTSLPGLYLAPSLFEKQLQVMVAQKYNTVFVSDIAASLKEHKSLPSRTIALSFDDGYEDFCTYAFPLLQKYHIKSTIYIIINALDKPGYLTTKQVEYLAKSGLVEIGSHTFDHPDLRKLSPRALDYEISLSRGALERLTGQKILTFAYPYGYYQPDMFKIASSTGYLAAVTVHPGSLESSSAPWTLTRLRPGARIGATFANWLKYWLKS